MHEQINQKKKNSIKTLAMKRVHYNRHQQNTEKSKEHSLKTYIPLN